jgi:hypothetical protein
MIGRLMLREVRGRPRFFSGRLYAGGGSADTGETTD